MRIMATLIPARRAAPICRRPRRSCGMKVVRRQHEVADDQVARRDHQARWATPRRIVEHVRGHEGHDGQRTARSAISLVGRKGADPRRRQAWSISEPISWAASRGWPGW